MASSGSRSSDCRAEIRLESMFSEEVMRSVEPEVGRLDGRSTTCARHDGAFVVEVESSDLVSLRAGVNTWMRLCEVAESALEGSERVR